MRRPPAKFTLAPIILPVSLIVLIVCWTMAPRAMFAADTQSDSAEAIFDEAVRIEAKTDKQRRTPGGDKGPATYAEAVELCDKFLALEPNNSKGWLLKAQLERKLARSNYKSELSYLRKAQECSEKASQLAPGQYATLLGQGRTYFDLAYASTRADATQSQSLQYAQLALQSFEAAQALNEPGTDLFKEISEIKKKIILSFLHNPERFLEALTACKSLIDLCNQELAKLPNNGLAFKARADALNYKSELEADKKLPCYDKALALADISAAVSDYGRARQLKPESIALSPFAAGALMIQSKLELATADRKKAHSTALKALDSIQEDLRAHNTFYQTMLQISILDTLAKMEEQDGHKLLALQYYKQELEANDFYRAEPIGRTLFGDLKDVRAKVVQLQSEK